MEEIGGHLKLINRSEGVLPQRDAFGMDRVRKGTLTPKGFLWKDSTLKTTPKVQWTPLEDPFPKGPRDSFGGCLWYGKNS